VQVAILLPLTGGIVTVLCTIVVHGLALGATVNFVRRERRLGHFGASYGSDLVIVVVAILLIFGAHLIEIAIWAMVFIQCGEFPAFGLAFDHSAVNYTTVGNDNVIMTPRWRLLGSLEAADGMLMFGITTAMIFALIQWLIRVRFPDLRD